MNRTTVYLSDENLRQLAEEAERTGKKSAEIIRSALEWYFEFKSLSRLTLTPISPDSPQDKVAKRLAELLAADGVDDTAALPTAIGILAGIQSALNSGNLMDAVSAWDKDKRDEEEFFLRHHPKSKTAKEIRKRRKDSGEK